MRVRTVTARPIGTIPLPEVSGLALGRDRQGQLTLVAVGDRAATIAWAPLNTDVADLAWQALDLRHAQGSGIPQEDPQLEAVAVDGHLGVLLVAEFPNRAELFDATERRLRAQVLLDVPDLPGLSDVFASWQDPEGSHTEGVALLRDGHLLLVKEKDPCVLLEMGPPGARPGGFGPERWLPDDQPWQVPAGEATLTCLAVWRPDPELAQACPDLSDAAVAPDGRLVLTGDQAQVLVLAGAHLPAEDPFSGELLAGEIWSLHGIREKPEGVVVLPDGTVLVACDRRKAKENLFAVEPGGTG